LKGPKKQYEKRRMYYARRSTELTQTINQLSNVRLALFFGGCALAVFLYITQSTFLGLGVLLVTMISFTALVLWHQRLRIKQNYIQALSESYGQALKRLTGEWKSFTDTGEDFIDPAHPYSEDLDLFGPSSLFQWINTAKTYRGRDKLKEWLTVPPVKVGIIEKKQEAIKELAKNIAWRHRFMTEAATSKRPFNSPARIIEWAKTYDSTYLRPGIVILARALPIITLAFLLFYFLTPSVSFWYPLAGFLIQTIILFTGKQRGKALEAVYNYKESIRIYENMLKRFENRTFKSDYLRELQKGLSDRDGTAAFEQIRKLSSLAELISNRDNSMFLVLNILTLWDIQCMIALESWKEKSGRFLEQWIDTVAELEGLASLSVIYFDHREWVLPNITSEYSGIIAANIGHPLLADSTCNDLSIDKHSAILLITGSNMSGKSTLLRTVGINLILAYAGAPVCAQSFSCSILRIYTCMRVIDNLGENISSFYAELLRIKQIVIASKTEEKIFFLLDEIFKGTNSQDRHEGAKILIRQLSKAGAMGMVSTHDLELGDLERESELRIKNYHFREFYENNKIYFDYKLRPGVSTTRNAMYLIKMAGIDVD
jgi:DNA mismatch repair ATPase MutS